MLSSISNNFLSATTTAADVTTGSSETIISKETTGTAAQTQSKEQHLSSKQLAKVQE